MANARQLKKNLKNYSKITKGRNRRNLGKSKGKRSLGIPKGDGGVRDDGFPWRVMRAESWNNLAR